MDKERIVILIHCPDKKGIIAKVTSWCYEKGMNVLHCQQCLLQDEETMMFFMRIEMETESRDFNRSDFEKEFSLFSVKEGFSCEIHFAGQKEKVAVLVSKTSHCLYEILSHYEEGDIPNAEISMVVANHDTLRNVADKFDIPFHYFPIIDKDKVSQERKIISLLKQEKIDLVILARYMQILTPDFIEEYRNRIINIHHGFLPAFQGANPYLQAYNRGVKIIGASAHYASEDLDQGPIIEQDTVRVNHEAGPALLREMGKDVEKRTLMRAVAAHLEHRIIVCRNKTVVFSKEG